MRPTKEALIVRRALDLRIARWQSKLAYIAALILLRYTVVMVLAVVGVPALAVNITDSVLLLAGIILGARIFRGKGEQSDPARSWWQMTAWPKLSRRLGISVSIINALVLVYVVLLATGVAPERRSNTLTLGEWIASIAFNAVVGVLYLHSAIRQTRAGVVAPAPAVMPSFKSSAKFR